VTALVPDVEYASPFDLSVTGSIEFPAVPSASTRLALHTLRIVSPALGNRLGPSAPISATSIRPRPPGRHLTRSFPIAPRELDAAATSSPAAMRLREQVCDCGIARNVRHGRRERIEWLRTVIGRVPVSGGLHRQLVLAWTSTTSPRSGNLELTSSSAPLRFSATRPHRGQSATRRSAPSSRESPDRADIHQRRTRRLPPQTGRCKRLGASICRKIVRIPIVSRID